MTIQSLFEIPHRFDECIDFIASNFGNLEFHKQCLGINAQPVFQACPALFDAVFVG
jgi:hypothetical protein